MTRVRSLAVLVVGFLPASRSKNRLLNFLGYDIALGAIVAPSVIHRVSHVTMAEGALIGFGNCFRDLSRLELGAEALIGQWNWISAAVPFYAASPHNRLVGTLVLEAHAAITSRHYVDVTGGCRIGAFATVAGVRSTLVTHGIDVARCTQTAAGIRVGRYSLVGSNCKIVPGANVPDRCVIGMGSTVTKSVSGEGMLHAGSPARPVREVHDGEYFVRTRGAVSKIEDRANDKGARYHDSIGGV